MQPLSAVAGSAAGKLGFTFGDTVTELAGHVVHSWLPVASLYVPAGHAPHCKLPVLVYPCIQIQFMVQQLPGRLVEKE